MTSLSFQKVLLYDSSHPMRAILRYLFTPILRAVSERNDHNLLPRQLYINDNHIDLNVFEHLPQPNVSNNNSNNNNNNYLPPAIIQTDIVLTQPIRDTPEPGNRALRFDPASGTFVPASPPPPINPPVLLPPINPPPLLPSSPPPFRAEAVGVLEEPSLPAAYAQPVSSSSLINLPAVSMLAQAPATLDDDIVIVSAVDVFDDIDHDRHHDVAGENFDNNDNDRGSTDHSNRNSTGGDASTDANLSLILEAQRRLEVEMEGRRASENMHSNNRNKVKLENDNKVNSNSSVDDNDSVGNEDENSILSFAPLVRFESADMPGRIKSSSLSSSSSSLASNSARSQGNQNQLLRELHLARQEKKGQETELDMKREREARELRQEQEMLAVEKEQKETERRKRQEEEAEEQRKRLAEEDGKAKKKREDREKQEKKAFEKLLKEEKKLEKERGRKRDVREIKAMVRLAKQRTPPLSPKQPPATRAITQGRTGSRALKKKRSANSKVKRQAKVKVERLKTMERRKKERKELKSQSSFVALKIEHQDTVDTFVVNGMVKPVDRELEIERERLIRLSDKDGNIPCMPCLGKKNHRDRLTIGAIGQSGGVMRENVVSA